MYTGASLKVAVIREEGTNGDREMSAALFMAGFEVWDITVQDLLNEAVDIEQFRGLIFPGGFSYGGIVIWLLHIIINGSVHSQFSKTD